MGVQVIHYKDGLRYIGILFIQKAPDLFGPILSYPVFLRFSISPSVKGFCKHKDAGSTISDILVILLLDPASL